MEILEISLPIFSIFLKVHNIWGWRRSKAVGRISENSSDLFGQGFQSGKKNQDNIIKHGETRQDNIGMNGNDIFNLLTTMGTGINGNGNGNNNGNNNGNGNGDGKF